MSWTVKSKLISQVILCHAFLHEILWKFVIHHKNATTNKSLNNQQISVSMSEVCLLEVDLSQVYIFNIFLANWCLSICAPTPPLSVMEIDKTDSNPTLTLVCYQLTVVWVLTVCSISYAEKYSVLNAHIL